MAWTPSENCRQEHDEDTVRGKARWQEKVYWTVWRTGVGRWRLKISVRGEWAAVVRDAKALHGVSVRVWRQH
jgi:hypothetical protein